MKLLVPILLASAAHAQTWVSQPSGTTASMRGVSAVNDKVVWASGTNGTYLKTTNGGQSWTVATVPGTGQLDFRAVRGVDSNTAYLLSIGEGEKSRIYRTNDGGSHWNLQLTNPDPKGFFDALAFWNPEHGIAVGDPVDGQFAVFTTSDGGGHWARQRTPPALAGEGTFAASNSCLTVRGNAEAWFATGGPGAARVFHSKDGGSTWTVSTTPIRNDGASSGVFSLAFADALHGIAVGGDYSKAEDASHNIAITADGGLTWTEPTGTHPHGFRSAVVFVPERSFWIATGTSGSDVSSDGGKNWKQFDSGAFNAISVAKGGAGWAVGPQGRLAKFQ